MNTINLTQIDYNKLYTLQQWAKHVPSWYKMTPNEMDQIDMVSYQLIDKNLNRVDCNGSKEYTIDDRGNLYVVIHCNIVDTEYMIIG